MVLRILITALHISIENELIKKFIKIDNVILTSDEKKTLEKGYQKMFFKIKFENNYGFLSEQTFTRQNFKHCMFFDCEMKFAQL